MAQATYPNGTVVTFVYDGNGNRISATAVADTVKPTPPASVTSSSLTPTSAVIGWTAATDPNVGITGYAYSVNGGAYSSFSAYSSGLSLSLTGLTPGATYTVGIEAQDVAGNIGAPTTVTFTVPPAGPGGFAVSAITGTSATVSWTAPSDSAGITGYSYQLNGGAWSAFSSATSANLTGLAYGTAYTVGVRTQDKAGNTGATTTTAFTTAPGAPGTPTFSNVSATSATMSWTAAASAVGIGGYRYSLNGGSTWTSVGTALSASLTGLSGATSYTVQVEAENPSGTWGASSSSGSVTTGNYTDNLTLTPGEAAATQPGPGGTVGVFEAADGYSSGSMGSLSPTTLSGGKTVVALSLVYVSSTPTTLTAMFSVSGFTTTPTASWLVSLTVPGMGLSLTGSKATLSCSSGTCSWTWPGAVTGNTSKFTTATASVTVVHQ